LNTDLKQDDLLVTSGLGGRFPAGFPVGTVTELRTDDSRAFLVGEVKPAAHLDRGRDVLLLRSAPARNRLPFTAADATRALPGVVTPVTAAPPAGATKEAAVPASAADAASPVPAPAPTTTSDASTRRESNP